MKKFIKISFYRLMFVLVFPWGLAARYIRARLGSAYLFHFFTETLSLLPVHMGIYCRTAFYHLTLNRAPHNLITLFGAILTNMDICIGDNVIIGGRTTIGLCDIGNHANIGNRTTLLSGRYHHNFKALDDQMMVEQASLCRIRIGRNSFIGDNCTVMADIGEYSIIGAGSVVVKPIPAYVIAVGNPARVIKKRRKLNPDVTPSLPETAHEPDAGTRPAS